MNTTDNNSLLSIVLPAKNEAESLAILLPEIKRAYKDAEILVVDDGSDDKTASVCKSANITCITHPYSKGNGAAIKTGARHARGDIIVFMDADGQHQPSDIKLLLEKIDEKYDMVVGMRSTHAQASLFRNIANRFYNAFASIVTGHRIGDLTSGFRAVRASHFRQFLYLLPNGFSSPSTITMAFFRAGYSVTYVPVNVLTRLGKSHIRPFRDGIRFLLIIFRIGTLYSPLKIFVPASLLFLTLGFSHYFYNYITHHKFTNMSALLFITAMLIFLIGLVSEQITSLLYIRSASSDETVTRTSSTD